MVRRRNPLTAALLLTIPIAILLLTSAPAVHAQTIVLISASGDGAMESFDNWTIIDGSWSLGTGYTGSGFLANTAGTNTVSHTLDGGPGLYNIFWKKRHAAGGTPQTYLRLKQNGNLIVEQGPGFTGCSYLGNNWYSCILNSQLSNNIPDEIQLVAILDSGESATFDQLLVQYDPDDPTPTPEPTPTATPPPPPPPEPIDNPYVVPTGCYNCVEPASLIDLSHWIAWLACIISNLFFCYLRIWLQEITNSIIGVITTTYALITWLPTQGQAAANWFAATIQGFANTLEAAYIGIINTNLGGTITIQESDSFLDVLFDLIADILGGIGAVQAILDIIILLVQMFLSVVTSLLAAARWFVTIITGTISSLQIAFTAAPFEFDMLYPSAPGSLQALQEGMANAEVGNTLTIFIAFMWAIMTIDDTLYYLEFQYWQFVIIGIIAWTLIPWLLVQWRNIIPHI